MAKAFIFSIDAFVAFTLIIVVLHSLIFLAAVPSSYYAGLTQANYLARDTLTALSYANASRVLQDEDFAGVSLLHYIVSTRSEDAVREYVGKLIPDQYGYALQFHDSDGVDWSTIYDTAGHPEDTHNKEYHKLRVSSSSIFFGYTDSGRRGMESPYCYITCHGPECPTVCDEPLSQYETGDASLGLVRLVVYR